MGSQHLLSSMLLLLFLSSFIHMAALGRTPSSTKLLHIVYMGERQHEDPDRVTASHHDVLSSVLGSKEEAVSSIVYSYKHGFSGFAAMLTESQADQIAGLREVINIEASRSFPLHTTRSWDFLGLNYEEQQPSGLLERGKYGDGIIIGVVDTGIWPESRSFDDSDYGPVPSRWKGTCDAGEESTIRCNKKIIGARYYKDAVDPSRISEDEYKSPRDAVGHGTHTASTAAGSLVSDASFDGLGAGTARGGAPRARLAIYKVCWKLTEGGDRCEMADVLQAIDDAVGHGVHILSLSIGGHGYFLASLGAVKKGITVVFSGGNDGPVPQTINNAVPWVITVAASTIDRSFPTVITLGDKRTVVGQSMCYASSDPGDKELVAFDSCSAVPQYLTHLADKIVLCFDGAFAAGETSELLASLTQAGARGAIIARYPRSLLPDCSGITCVLVDYDVGRQIANYFRVETASGRIPVVHVNPASNLVGSQVMSPRVAAFSSRGPSIDYPDLVKPDITAPGVDILAAVRDGYQFMSGTSMACPHVSGVAALLKVVYPDWSPAAIKSALVTTAHTANAYGFPIEAEGVPRKLADPFDFGGGHIDPNKSADPGLIYDVDPEDYSKFFNCTYAPSSTCDLVDSRLYRLNLPSIAIPDLKKTPLTVWRTVTNVGDTDSIYSAMVESPPGVDMVVEPSLLQFNASTTTHTFAVTFTPLQMVQGDFNFGSLTWLDDGKKHAVRIPIAVRVIIYDSFSDTS